MFYSQYLHLSICHILIYFKIHAKPPSEILYLHLDLDFIKFIVGKGDHIHIMLMYFLFINI